MMYNNGEFRYKSYVFISSYPFYIRNRHFSSAEEIGIIFQENVLQIFGHV